MRRPVVLGACLAALGLLGACAGTPKPAEAPPPAPAAPVEAATVLLPVRLAGPVDPDGPAPLMELALATPFGRQAAFTQVPQVPPVPQRSQQLPQGQQVPQFLPQGQQVPRLPAQGPQAPQDPAAGETAGAGRDYLFRLPLPQGRYRVVALQLREGSQRRMLALDLPFEVDSPAPRYLGRLIVQPGPDGTLALETAWQPHEDIARYRALPASGLRSQGVQLQPVVARGPAAAAALAAAAPAPAASAAAPRPDPMDTVLAGASPALRQAFQRYRALKTPKAFAVSDDGRWASAQGAGDAPVRSLVDCAHQGARCRLLAINDRLVVQGAR